MVTWDVEPIDVRAAEEVSAFFDACNTADGTVRRLPADAFREWARLARPSLAVVRDGATVVGFAYSSHSECRVEERVLQHFRSFVLPTHRRRGVATALLRWVEGLAQDGPRPGLQCSVLFDWDAGDAFLRRHGFAVISVDVGMERPAGAVGPPRPPTGIALRPASAPRDFPAWIRVHNAAYARDRMCAELDEERAQAHAARDGFALTLAEDAGRVIGFCMTLAEKDGSAHVESIAVHPDARRRGLGRALLRHALDALGGAAGRAVTLDSHRGSGAYALYVSEGFRETYRESVFRRDLVP